MNWPRGFRQVYSSYRSRAHKHGIQFGLSTEETFFLLASACYYCGHGPEREFEDFICGTIDRIDPKGGYVPANCRPACWTCNKAKNDRADQDFIDWIVRVYQNLQERHVIADT